MYYLKMSWGEWESFHIVCRYFPENQKYEGGHRNPNIRQELLSTSSSEKWGLKMRCLYILMHMEGGGGVFFIQINTVYAGSSYILVNTVLADSML